jgi:hypothetical protein
MAIEVKCFTVVVRKDTLEAKYPGGVAQYAAACPNRTFQQDKYLTGVSFMGPDEVKYFVESLKAHGLVHIEPADYDFDKWFLNMITGQSQGNMPDPRLVEIALVDMVNGLWPPLSTCEWLKIDRKTGNARFIRRRPQHTMKG